MTASESLLTLLESAWARLNEISPGALALNITLTLVVLGLAWGAAVGLRKMVRLGVRRLPGPANAEKQVRASRATRFSWLVFRLLLGAAAIVAVAAVWGFDLPGFLTRGIGSELAQTILRSALLLVAAVIAMEMAAFFINLSIERLKRRSRSRRRAAQLSTLGPILRGAVHAIIVTIVGLTLLGELGLRIGPLLAGAGVVGVALGFGAQTLVKDFLTGIFLLIEDIVAVGDIVRIGDSSGVVEEMTLRTIRLRAYDGTLHVIPFGEAQIVHNLTKTFSFYVFEIQISYGSDIGQAMQIMRTVSAELQQDPEFTQKILEPLDVAGVDALGDSGVVLKARIKTLPGDQWGVGRELNRRIKLAFDEAGVEIPFPHMKLVLPEQQLAALGDDPGDATRSGAPN